MPQVSFDSRISLVPLIFINYLYIKLVILDQQKIYFAKYCKVLVWFKDKINLVAELQIIDLQVLALGGGL